MSYKTDSKLAVYSKAYSLLEREFKELQNSRSKVSAVAWGEGGPVSSSDAV